MVALPDERAGDVLVPIFERDVDMALVVATLTTYQERAPGFRRLQSAVMVERFPRSELGKLRRRELTETCLSALEL